MGSLADRERRAILIRKDDKTRQDSVTQARTFINHKGYVVTSKHVETLLKPESLVPTEVSPHGVSLDVHADGIY